MKKILVAEADREIGAALKIRLLAAGYAVLVLTNGIRSYTFSGTGQPDLILLDFFQPIGSAMVVAQELRDAGLAHIPIIFMTASKLRNLRARAEAMGAVAFFEKPFDIEELLATISRVLQPRLPTSKAQQPAPAVLNQRITM